MEHGGRIELNPTRLEEDIRRLPLAYRDMGKQCRPPEGLELPPPRIVPEFLLNRTPGVRAKVQGYDLVANFMQGISARAQDPGRWWWKAPEALKQAPMNEYASDAKTIARHAISDLGKATRTKRQKAGFLRLPSGQGVRPEPHPKPTLGWYLCIHAADKGGALWFPHAGVIMRLNAGDAVLFPLAGGFAVAPVEHGYVFAMLSFQVPEPRLNLHLPGDGIIVP